MPLFRRQDFISAAGVPLTWKIECDALDDEDWATIASVAAPKLPPFHTVFGVPTGGFPLARALQPYEKPDGKVTLIVDDVWTTGKSIREYASFLDHAVEDTEWFVAFDRSGTCDVHCFMKLGN